MTKKEIATVATPAALLGLKPNVAAAITDSKSPDEFADALTDAIEKAVLAMAAKAGPVPSLAARVLLSTIVEPIVDAIMAIITHIGMQTPQLIGNLVEKIESGVNFDLNGDGFIGDPEKEKDANHA